MRDGFGCPICICCHPFNQATCNDTCATQGKVPIDGAKDDSGCFNCQCQCPKYDAKTCESTCAANQAEPVENAKDPLSECSICACCDRYVHSECVEECKVKGKIPELLSTGCKTCNCMCEPYDNDACQASCDESGKTVVPDAIDSFGCPYCQCG